MGDVVNIEEGKSREKADKVLQPMYQELANLELQVKTLRGEVLKTERRLLPKEEAVHRALMRRASKLDW